MIYGKTFLTKRGIASPFLEAVILLACTLELTKEKLFMDYPENVDTESVAEYKNKLKDRAKGIPTAYITKQKEFFGLTFFVDSRVLIPRPDTEIIIESVAELITENKNLKTLHDCCTGSGCIPITLKNLFPELIITASDISPDVRQVFEKNCDNLLQTRINFYLSDLFSKIPHKYDIITANPPYLTSLEVRKMKEQKSIEPELGLNGGQNGTEVLKRLIEEGINSLNSNGFIVVEAAIDQIDFLINFMQNFPCKDVYSKKDLTGRNRIVIGQKI